MATPVRTELCIALIAAFMSVAGPLSAEPIRPALVVTRDDGSRECPDGAVLGERVETVTGKGLFTETPNESRDTWVQVEFVRAIGGYRAVISAHGRRQGTRALDDVGPECTSLAEAVAVTLAILLDPAAATNAESTPPDLPKPTPTPRPVDATPSRPQTSRVEAGRSASRFGVEASAGASLAVLDGVVPFVEGGGRGRFGDVFVLGAGGGYVLPDSVEFGEGSITLSLPYGYARACANVLPRRRTVLEACLEAMLGGLRGEGQDYEVRNTDWVFWSAAAALFQAYGPVSETVFWSLRARLLAPLARDGFSVVTDGSKESAFEVSPIAGSLALGIEASL